MRLDPATDYPLGLRRPELVQTPSGRPLADVTMEEARAGRLDAGDLRATATTLELQADVARSVGRAQLAANLERAAELVALSEEELLALYTALRPGRSTAAALDGWATLLEGRGAARTAAFVREAAEAYADAALLVDG